MPALACAALAVKYRPALLDRSHTPSLDVWMFAVLAAAVLQTVPLPRAVISIVSPAALTVARTLALVDTGGPLPISIDLPGSAAAILLIAGVLVIFFTARQIFAHRGHADDDAPAGADGPRALGDRAGAGRDRARADVLALEAARRGAKPVRSVRQPQPFRDLGDDGGAVVHRVPDGARLGPSRRVADGHVAAEGGGRDRRASVDASRLGHAAHRRDCGLAVAIGAPRAHGRAGLRRDAGPVAASERRRLGSAGWRQGRFHPRTDARRGARHPRDARGAHPGGSGGNRRAVRRQPRRRGGSGPDLARYPTGASRLLADRNRGGDLPDVHGRLPAEQSGRDLQPGP